MDNTGSLGTALVQGKFLWFVQNINIENIKTNSFFLSRTDKLYLWLFN